MSEGDVLGGKLKIEEGGSQILLGLSITQWILASIALFAGRFLLLKGLKALRKYQDTNYRK